MDRNSWVSTLLQFLILFPAGVSCYFPMKNQMKYTTAKTARLCFIVLVPYCIICTSVCTVLQLNINTILLPSLFIFFFLYNHTVKSGIPKALAVYAGVCAIETFPSQFANILDAYLNPLSGMSGFSIPAALFQLFIACIIMVVFLCTAYNQSAYMIDNLNSPKVWYFTHIISFIFLVFNVLAVPYSYNTLHTSPFPLLFPVLECCAFILLVTIYVLFYQSAMVILEHTKLEKRSQLLEMQAHQYHTLQEYMTQTSRLRHDFRHSVHLLASLANKGDLESIKTHLAEYETAFAENITINYCNDASLNSLFSYYHEMAVLSGIKTNWKTSLPKTFSIPGPDMAALFGNIMENAIGGCQTLPEEQRYFTLVTEIKQGNNLYIVSTNSFNGHVKKKNGIYHSTKHSGQGTGLISIIAAAEKYNGYAQISDNGKEFFIDVMIKI